MYVLHLNCIYSSLLREHETNLCSLKRITYLLLDSILIYIFKQ